MRFQLVFLAITAVFLAACATASPASTPLPTLTPTPTTAPVAASLLEPTATSILAPTSTSEPAATPSPTSTPVPSPVGVPIATGFTIYFIDVGQGDATLIVASNGETLLLDGGRSESRIRERLQSLDIKDLDAIAMTHPDADHIGGLVEVLELYPIERIYLNGGTSATQTFRNLTAGIDQEGAAVITLSRGHMIRLGGLAIKVLHPGAHRSGDTNVDSLVLQVSCGQVEVLLTGDAEASSEQAMLATGVLSDIDVLKVGHHGSRSSTTQTFLAQVRPEVGIISSGSGNQYGHPHLEVVDRLVGAGVKVMVTDTTEADDTLALSSDCDTYQLERASGVAEPVPGPAAPRAAPLAPRATASPTPTRIATLPIGSRTGIPLKYAPAGPDRNCGDFGTWPEAQNFYEAAGCPQADRHRLDGDRDGIACESLPGAPYGKSDSAAPPGGGPTARCRDGTYSYSKNRRGTCSHHGGVAEWY